jgi:protein-tyrosine phosphatase
MSGAVTRVTFERNSEGHGIVAWSVAGGCDRVDIAVATSPDAFDHQHTRTVDAAAGRTYFDDMPPGRAYVSVVPSGGGSALIAGERNLGLLGPTNFRDLGGYVGAGGARTRWGRTFRADALVLEESDFTAFSLLGVRAIYDLRSDAEREVTPDRLPDGEHVVELIPLMSSDSAVPMPTIDELLADGEALLASIYVRLLEHSAVTFGRILTGLADDTRLPAVFHCAAGKDRTGMVAALLLSVLGVSNEDILDDYELTSRYRHAARTEAFVERLRTERGVAPEVAAGILRTPRWAMQGALVELEGRYGGIDGYLTGPAEADPSVPEALRALLLA